MPVAVASLGFLWLLLGLWGRWQAPREAIWAALALWLGAALPWGLVTLFFAGQGGAAALWQQVWLWPMAHYRVAGSANEVWPLSDFGDRLLPMWQAAMSPWLWLVKVLATTTTSLVPLMAGLAALLVLPARFLVLKRQPLGPQGPLALTLAFATLLVAYFALRGRADWAHLAMASPFGLWAWAWWASNAWKQAPAPSFSAQLASAWPAVAMLLWLGACGLNETREARLAWRQGHVGLGLSAIQRGQPLQVALRQHLAPGATLWAFPSSGASYLFGPGRHATHFGLFLPLWALYQGPEEYKLFRSDWAKRPPDAVLLVGRDAAKAVAEWGGSPTLDGYRKLGVFPGPPGEEVIPHELWLR